VTYFTTYLGHHRQYFYVHYLWKLVT